MSGSLYLPLEQSPATGFSICSNPLGFLCVERLRLSFEADEIPSLESTHPNSHEVILRWVALILGCADTGVATTAFAKATGRRTSKLADTSPVANSKEAKQPDRRGGWL